MESAKEINITYETLFEVLKRERDMADLQKLEPNFFSNFVDYLNEKRKMMEKEDSLFSYDEKKKVERQIDNAQRMIKELYERREKKIINIALIKSRTKSNVIDTSSILENERKFLEEIENLLNRYRDSVMNNIVEGRSIPYLRPNFVEISKEQGNLEHSNRDFLDAVGKETEKKDVKLVRFLCPVPKFVGKELEEYGPFSEEDIANLPSEIADLLIAKARVEEINSN